MKVTHIAMLHLFFPKKRNHTPEAWLEMNNINLHLVCLVSFCRLGPEPTSMTAELEYNSLYDKHLTNHFYSRGSVREHLTGQHIITDDWRVVGSRDEFFQGLRAQRELLAREEIVSSIAARQERRMARMRMAGHLAQKKRIPRKLEQLEVNHADRRHAAQQRKIRRAVQKEAEIATRTATAKEQERVYRTVRRQQHHHSSYAPQRYAVGGNGAGGAHPQPLAEADQLSKLEKLLRKQIRCTSLTDARINSVETETSRRYTIRLPEAAGATGQGSLSKITSTLPFPREGGLDLLSVAPQHLHAALVSEQRALQTRLDAMGVEPPSVPRSAKSARVKSSGKQKSKGKMKQQRKPTITHQNAALPTSPSSLPAGSSMSKKAATKQQNDTQTPADDTEVGNARSAFSDQEDATDITNARAKLQRERDGRLTAGAVESPLVDEGWKADAWLSDSARELVRSIDPRRTGAITHAELMQVLSSGALGLDLDATLLEELSKETEPSGGASSNGQELQVNYEDVFAKLQDTLSTLAFADEHILKPHWCTVYSPTLRCDLRYNRATRMVHRPSEHPSAANTSAAARRSSQVEGGGGEPEEGAVGRAVSRVMRDAGRDLVGELQGPGIMEEEDFYLVLQSSGLGLRLLAADIERVQDELPPGEDGTVRRQELCDDIEETIVEAHATHADSEGNFMTETAIAAAWCRLWSPVDGIFFFNKVTGTTTITRPAEFTYGPGDDDIEDFLFGMFEANEQLDHDERGANYQSNGMLREELFWELLEKPAPAGLGIIGDDAFLYLTKFDRTVDGWVPWRDFVTLFRGLAVQVSAESETAHGAGGEDWLELQTSQGAWFFFDKVSGANIRSIVAAVEA